MLSKTKKTNRFFTSKTLIVTGAILIALILVFIVLEKTGLTHFIDSFTAKTITQPKANTTNSSKQNSVNPKGGNTNSGKVIEPVSSDISLSTRVEANGSITVLTELRNYNNGTCDLTITNGSEIYTKSAPVLYQDSYSTCEGFNVQSDALPHGTWQISLAVTSKGKVNIVTASVEVN